MSMSNCVIYARVYGDSVSKYDESLDAQVKKCEQYARKKRLRVVAIHRERPNSFEGSELLGALMDLQKGDSLIVTDIYHVPHPQIIRERLEGQGGRLIALERDFTFNEQEELMEGIMKNLCEYFERQNGAEASE